MAAEEEGPRIEVVEVGTGKVVRVIPLPRTDERWIDRVMEGLLINMDTDHYFAREVLPDA